MCSIGRQAGAYRDIPPFMVKAQTKELGEESPLLSGYRQSGNRVERLPVTMPVSDGN